MAKCPHCRVTIHEKLWTTRLGNDREGAWGAVEYLYPACNQLTVYLAAGNKVLNSRAEGDHVYEESRRFLAYPKSSGHSPAQPEVPVELADDYREACLVLADSPKASAALSRRCLQQLLRTAGGAPHSDLSKEIDSVLPKLPSHLSGDVDAIRNVGNFAAHPMKSTSTGLIVPVENGEAEWLIEVLYQLFDFYFVQPELQKKRREALDAKLADIKKPPMK